MRAGDAAQVTRAFSAEDLAEYRALCGDDTTGRWVPEPLIGALFSYLLGMQLPGLGTMYLKQDTRFSGRAGIGETLTAEVRITRLRPDKHLADLETRCRRADGEQIACGRALVYVGDVDR